MRTMKQSGPWSSLGTHGSLVVIWLLCVFCSGETGNFDFFKLNLTLTVKVNCTPNYRDHNQGILHLWSKFGGPSLNGWWVMVQRNSKWGKFGLSYQIWPWRSRSITPQNNRDLNQGILHLWTKFGDPHLNWSRVMARTNKCHT